MLVVDVVGGEIHVGKWNTNMNTETNRIAKMVMMGTPVRVKLLMLLVVKYMLATAK